MVSDWRLLRSRESDNKNTDDVTMPSRRSRITRVLRCSAMTSRVMTSQVKGPSRPWLTIVQFSPVQCLTSLERAMHTFTDTMACRTVAVGLCCLLPDCNGSLGTRQITNLDYFCDLICGDLRCLGRPRYAIGYLCRPIGKSFKRYIRKLFHY